MKTFTTSGTGSQQTLSELETDKLPLYNSLADAEADLANLEEGQIVATKDTGDELAQPVNTVQAGNLHAVTSNAVYNMAEKITDYTVGNGYTFNGTVVKIGKIVFIDGKVSNSIHSNSGNILSNLPVNKSGVGKDQNVLWLSSDWTSIAGYSVLSFDNDSTNLAIEIGSAPVGSTQISFSYITD